jgi:hypothetical protein
MTKEKNSEPTIRHAAPDTRNFDRNSFSRLGRLSCLRAIAEYEEN